MFVQSVFHMAVNLRFILGITGFSRTHVLYLFRKSPGTQGILDNTISAGPGPCLKDRFYVGLTRAVAL